MSKAFTKDDGSGDVIVAIAPRRAPLPEGVPNYVTPRGLSLLQGELAALGRMQPDVSEGSELDRARALQLHQARVSELESRIRGAIVVSPQRQPRDEVRFGAKVTVRGEASGERTYQVVGVDEADAARGSVAFVAPLARALLGKRVGELVLVPTPSGEDELEIVGILYE